MGIPLLIRTTDTLDLVHGEDTGVHKVPERSEDVARVLGAWHLADRCDVNGTANKVTIRGLNGQETGRLVFVDNDVDRLYFTAQLAVQGVTNLPEGVDVERFITGLRIGTVAGLVNWIHKVSRGETSEEADDENKSDD